MSSTPVTDSHIPAIWSAPGYLPAQPSMRVGGINSDKLLSLKYSPMNRSTLIDHDLPTQCSARMALINVWSVANKSFILNDFFMSCNLDFLFLPETWLNASDTASLCELGLYFIIIFF